MDNKKAISREELYRAVWTDPTVKVAKTLGLSDVGLAKIAKKLHVPVPGRGYWAKGPMERKLLKEPLPRVRPTVPTVHSFSRAPKPLALTEEPPPLPHLVQAGIAVPNLLAGPPQDLLPPNFASYRDRLLGLGLEADPFRWKEQLPAITVSPALLDRTFQILGVLDAACRSVGLEIEVLPPDPKAHNRFGREEPQPSRTGVLILDTFVAFELREPTHTVEVPPPPPPPPNPKRARRWAPEPDPYLPPKRWRQEGLGTLELALLQPSYAYGHRTHWRDGKRKRVEGGLNEFLRVACTLADRDRADALAEDARREAAELARKQKADAEARQHERALQLYDLESRLLECDQADRIRELACRVRAATEHADEAQDSDIMAWLAWAESLALDLETQALTTILTPRTPSPAKPQPSWAFCHDQAEENLRQEVDLWKRRFIYGRR